MDLSSQLIHPRVPTIEICPFSYPSEIDIQNADLNHIKWNSDQIYIPKNRNEIKKASFLSFNPCLLASQKIDPLSRMYPMVLIRT